MSALETNATLSDETVPDAPSTDTVTSDGVGEQGKELEAGNALGQSRAQQDGGDYPHGLRLFLVVFALLLSMFLVALDMTIVATAIPVITDEFDSVADIGWYASAFFITLGVFQAPWGKAYKHFNLKITFLTSVFLFELGSLICGVAQNSITLIIGRAIAGLGGAGVTGGIYTIMAFIVPSAQVPTYIGLVGAIFSLASVAGPLLGGVFTGEVTWRWCFYINLPVGGLALFLVTFFFKTPAAFKPVPIAAKDVLRVMDVPGIVLCLGLLICFTLAMQWGGVTKSWSSSNVIGTLVGFVVLGIAFVIFEWRSGENALIVTRIFKQRTVVAVSAFIFFLNAANFALIYNLPEYFQVIKGVSATESGVLNLPLILASALFAFGSGYVLGRVGYYQLFLIVGSAILTLGAGLVYTLDLDSSTGKIVGYQILVGMGIGSCIQIPVTAAQAFSDPGDIPVVTAVVLFFQLVSGAVWVSASQTLLNNRLVAALVEFAPNLDPNQVLAIGATEVRNVFHGADLDHVLQSYMSGLKDSWAMSIALAGLTFLASFAAQWRSLKGHRAAAVA